MEEDLSFLLVKNVIHRLTCRNDTKFHGFFLVKKSIATYTVRSDN